MNCIALRLASTAMLFLLACATGAQELKRITFIYDAGPLFGLVLGRHWARPHRVRTAHIPIRSHPISVRLRMQSIARTQGKEDL